MTQSIAAELRRSLDELQRRRDMLWEEMFTARQPIPAKPEQESHDDSPSR